jgi:hypothetical protein
MVLSSSSGAKIIYPDQKLTPIASPEKIKTTATTFAKVGGATALSVFIPVLHFITVPVGLLLTAFLSYSAYRKNYSLKDFEIHCPSCDQKSKVDVSGQDLPLRTFCSHCRHMVYLDN